MTTKTKTLTRKQLVQTLKERHGYLEQIVQDSQERDLYSVGVRDALAEVLRLLGEDE